MFCLYLPKITHNELKAVKYTPQEDYWHHISLSIKENELSFSFNVSRNSLKHPLQPHPTTTAIYECKTSKNTLNANSKHQTTYLLWNHTFLTIKTTLRTIYKEDSPKE